MQLSLLIGAVTLTGSLVAFAKLQELMSGGRSRSRARTCSALLVFLAILALALPGLHRRPLLCRFYGVCALSLLLGVLLVIPIGGADMPVVISLLNSYSGIAAA